METLKPHIPEWLRNGPAAKTAAAAAMFLSVVSPAFAKHEAERQAGGPETTQQVEPETPHIIFGTQDANPPKYNEKNHLPRIEQMANTAVRLHAGAQRIVINPINALRNREKDWAVYDLMFEEARKRGLDAYVTLSCKGVNWDQVKVMAAAANLVNREGRYIKWLTFCNEPNYHPDIPGYKNYELREMDGLTLAQTQHVIFLVGQRVVAQLAPQIQVGLGEILGEKRVKPAEFVEEMVQPVPEFAGDRPIRPDFFSIHPYGLLLDPTEPAPEGAWSINALDRVERLLRRLQDSGLLQTPDGNILPLYISEHGWIVDDPNQDQPESVRQLDDRQERRPFIYATVGYICMDQNVKMYINYGPLPRPYYKQGDFDTQVISVNDKPLPSFYALQKSVIAHPECFFQPVDKNLEF